MNKSFLFRSFIPLPFPYRIVASMMIYLHICFHSIFFPSFLLFPTFASMLELMMRKFSILSVLVYVFFLFYVFLFLSFHKKTKFWRKYAFEKKFDKSFLFRICLFIDIDVFLIFFFVSFYYSSVPFVLLFIVSSILDFASIYYRWADAIGNSEAKQILGHEWKKNVQNRLMYFNISMKGKSNVKYERKES